MTFAGRLRAAVRYFRSLANPPVSAKTAAAKKRAVNEELRRYVIELHGWPSHDNNSDVEFIWQKAKPGASRIISHLWKGVQQDSEKGLSKVHQSQKPVAVMEWCIGLVSPQRAILDPYMGSGTTGVAAVKLGRCFTGVEIDPDHYETALRRVSAALAAPTMFIAPPKPAKQESLLLDAQP